MSFSAASRRRKPGSVGELRGSRAEAVATTAVLSELERSIKAIKRQQLLVQEALITPPLSSPSLSGPVGDHVRQLVNGTDESNVRRTNFVGPARSTAFHSVWG